MANDRPLYVTLGQLAKIPDTDFIDPGAGVQFPNGSAAAPSVALNANSGFFWDTTNSGVGLTVGGTQTGWFVIGGPTFQHVGGSAVVAVQAEGTTSLQVTRYSTNANASQVSGRKARGTIASPSGVAQNDIVYQQVGSGYGTTAFQVCANAQYIVIEPTPSDTGMGGQYRISVTPLGSVTASEVARYEVATGLSMFGANPVIDANRTLIPGTSTISGLPAVVTSGMRNVSDLEGGQGTVFGGASFWRNMQNGQVAQSTISGTGVLSKMTGYFNFSQRAIVNNTMQKFSDAGLLSGKLLGLWFPAVPTNQTDGLLNWITPGTRPLVIIGSPTWTANQGFAGDGSTALLDTGATVATYGGSQNSFAIGVYVRTANTGSAKAVVGQNSASARGFYLQSFTSGALVARMMDGTNDNYTPGKYTGLFAMVRSASANYQASNDDAAATTITRTSTAVTNRTICFLGTNDTTGSEFSNAQVSAAFLGTGALTSGDIANITAIFEYYLTQMGAITTTVTNLPPAANFQGQTLYTPDLGGGAALLESDGTNWFRTGFDGYEARTTATGSETLTYLTNAGNVEYTATLLGNLTVTLSGTDAKGATVKKGAEFALTLDQPTPGIFTFAVKDGPSGNTLITFPVSTNKAALFVFNGTNWRLKMDSSL